MHQYHSLYEIAELIRQSLAQAEDLKDFIGNICCTSYPDIKQLEAEMPALEQQWPQFTERDERFNQLNPKEEGRGLVPTPCREKHGHVPKSSETGKEIRWGDIGMGRIPQFIREDRGINYSNSKLWKMRET